MIISRPIHPGRDLIARGMKVYFRPAFDLPAEMVDALRRIDVNELRRGEVLPRKQNSSKRT